MRLKLISCEVLYRELCHVVAHSPHTVDAEFVPKGLHDIGATPMCERLQAIVDRVDSSVYDATLLGYALCNNGLAGLRARSIPIVLPRGHDCITLYLGDRQRYLDYFDANPGVYFKTTGWIERGEVQGELTQLSVQRKTGMDRSYEELLAKYGEDNAKYLWETLCQSWRNYGQITFIEMGIEPDGSFEKIARDDAAQRGWKFDKVAGDMGLFERLINGPWNESEFLVVQPGCEVYTTFDEGIVAARPPTE